MICYTGIGSEATPRNILTLMEDVADELGKAGWILRTGHAEGADMAFERGARTNAQVFLPWAGYNSRFPVVADELFSNPSPYAYKLAARYHPAWRKLKVRTRRVHASNIHKLLGPRLDEPSVFVVCWATNGKNHLETPQMLRVARKLRIKVFNLKVSSDFQAVEDWLAKKRGAHER